MHLDLKTKTRFLLFAGLVVLTITANIFLVNFYKHSRQEIKEGFNRSFINECKITLDVYADLADLIYTLHIDNLETKKIFAAGLNSTNPHQKDHCRKLLLKKFTGLYQVLRKYDFRQLHFHQSDNKSYLRFHRPEKHGDNLSKIRKSVKFVNSYKHYISGFEEGAIYNGYRFVYPLNLNGKHLGSVEVSVSINSIIKKLEKNFHKKAQFIILKDHVKKKVLESEQSNYIPWCINEKYLLDREISEICILKNHTSKDDAIKIKQAINKNKGQPFIVEIDFDSQKNILTFWPIKNFEDKTAAYVFAIRKSHQIAQLDKGFHLVLTGIIFVYLLLIFFLIYYKNLNSKIKKIATTDYLTKINNRGNVMQIIEREYERYKRYKKTFSLIMIDIDHFKRVNDEHGHHKGDLTIAKIASLMKKSIRSSDSIGRYGGEEFIILLPETDRRAAVNVAEKLRKTIAAYPFKDMGMVTVSCGVVEMREEAATIEEVINEADKNLYKAKRAGRNRVVA